MADNLVYLEKKELFRPCHAPSPLPLLLLPTLSANCSASALDNELNCRYRKYKWAAKGFATVSQDEQIGGECKNILYKDTGS